MQELARITVPGGLVIIAVPNEGCPLAWFRNHVLQCSILRTMDHVHFYTTSLILERLQNTGLHPIGPIGKEGFFIPHLGVYTRMREKAFGRAFITLASRLWSQQAAGLVLAMTKAD